MAYKHLTIDELIWIEKYYETNTSVTKIAQKLKRARQTIYNVVNWLKRGGRIQEYYRTYNENKKLCGAKKKLLSKEEREYVIDRVKSGWTPDIIIGRKAVDLGISSRTLYRRFRDDKSLDINLLPMRGKRKKNGYKEKRGRQSFRRTLEDRSKAYPNYANEFGHLEGDTIIGKDHKSAVITLVERVSKAIITLKPKGRTAEEVQARLVEWFSKIPKNTFKSITFDCGKEFSNWRNICNKADISVFFADPGCPCQRGLNENSNALLRRDGLPKQTDFRDMDESDIISVANYRNNIPRKSLHYKTPLEVFMENIDLSSLS